MHAEYLYRCFISTTSEEMDGIMSPDYIGKMPASVAELGLNQLKKIDRYNQLRRRVALKWDNWCDEGGYRKPLVIEGSVPVFLRYPVMVEPEKKLDTSWASEELKVEAGVWFVTNLHPSNRRVEGCPNADKAVRQCINFPCMMEQP